MITMSNPFRQRMRLAQYETLLLAYEKRSNLLFVNGEKRCHGNSWAGNFWRGYDNINAKSWDPASKETMSYVCWRAGRDIAKREGK